MTGREKKLAMLLGVFAGGGLLLLLWQFVIVPWQESREQARKLGDEYAEKSSKLDTLLAKTSKLDAYKKRSLPADFDTARREYQALLHDLFVKCNIPLGYGVNPKDPTDPTRVPLLGPKHQAYNRVSFQIVLRKVDLPTLIRFLQAYYQQPVLQQITRFVIKKSAGDDSSGNLKSGARNDLEVTIDTEALIIDGVEKRKTLQPVSFAFAAIGGIVGWDALQNEPGPARHFTPAGIPSILSTDKRDYALLAAKDPFHGPLPELKPPPKVETKPEVVVIAPPQKFDISPFVRLNGITWRSDGTATAEIHDAANKQDYLVEHKKNITGDMVITVNKMYYLNNVAKRLESFDDLIIAEDDSSTDRHFKVLGFLKEPRGLLLLETPLPPKEEKPLDAPIDDAKTKEDPKAKTTGKSTGKTTGKNTFGKKPDTAKKGPQPLGALIGAMPFVPNPPRPKTYIWLLGQTLNKIEEVPAGVLGTKDSPKPDPLPIAVPVKENAPKEVPKNEPPKEVTPMPRLEK